MKIFYYCLLMVSLIPAENRNTKWTEDLDFLKHIVIEEHVRPFLKISKADFEREVDSVINQIDDLDDPQLNLETLRLIALLKDAHSRAQLSDQMVYPVLPYFFEEGFMVKYTLPENRAFIGSALNKINDTPIEEVIAKIRPLVNHDNEIGLKQFLPYLLIKPSVLHGIGVIDSPTDDAYFHFSSSNSKTSTVKLSPTNQNQFLHTMRSSLQLETVPLYLQNNHDFYWFEYLEEELALYVQYNFILSNKSSPINQFIGRIDSVIKNYHVEKIIIDNRNNQGGNLHTAKPFVNFLQGHPVLDSPGKLFLITGRRTASAAMFFAMELERKTNVITAGEPPGTIPNIAADSKTFTLPHSGIKVYLSTIFHEFSFPNDPRQHIIPELYYSPTIDEFLEGRDPVMEMIFSYTPKNDATWKLSGRVKEKIKGEYLFSPNKKITVNEQSGKLVLKITDFINARLTPLSDSLFATSINNEVFIMFDASSPGSMHLIAYDSTYTCRRLIGEYLLAKELFELGRLKEAVSRLKNTRVNNRWDIDVRESTLNSLGYRFLKNDNMDAAIEIFKLNTEFYPDSYNTWDSLAEAYNKMGETKKAVVYYKKSLEHNPENKNAINFLEALN